MKTEAEPALEKPYFKSFKMEIVHRKYTYIVNTKNVQFFKGLIKYQSKEINKYKLSKYQSKEINKYKVSK
jgi:hypothetical protein